MRTGRTIVVILSLLLSTAAGGAQADGDGRRGARATGVDTAAVAADSVRTAPAPVDTAGVHLEAVDPLLAWAGWPAIGPAIALDPLDGPADILEKEEIIADRIDALVNEGARLDTMRAIWHDRSLALAAQLEVLDDLAGLQLDGDLESQQRLDAVRRDLLEAQHLGTRVDGAWARLAQDLAALRALALDYRQRAAQLRAREERR